MMWSCPSHTVRIEVFFETTTLTPDAMACSRSATFGTRMDSPAVKRARRIHTLEQRRRRVEFLAKCLQHGRVVQARKLRLLRHVRRHRFDEAGPAASSAETVYVTNGSTAPTSSALEQRPADLAVLT